MSQIRRQETDPSSIVPNVSYAPYAPVSRDETYGGRADLRFLLRSTGRDLTRLAWKVTQQAEDEKVADQARGILLIIEEIISASPNFKPDDLPYLRASEAEDGSMLIEWIFDDFRIGFSIEPTSDKSSWYVVSNSRLGEISACGYIPQSESHNTSLILWLFNFVILYS